ncbi:MAG TPA: hypothetical protein VGN22_02495, partial [Pseudonocardia sp.]
CLLALDRHASLKVLIPHGPIGGELRAIGRDDARAARDQRRLLNRLRADLQTTYPAALAWRARTWVRRRYCGCCNTGPPKPNSPPPRGRSWSRSPAPAATADRVAAALAEPALIRRLDPAGRDPTARAARGPPRSAGPHGRAAAGRGTHRT